MRAAVVENGLVTNVIEVEDLQSFSPPAGELVEIPEATRAGPGWSYDGSVFTAPPPKPEPVPEYVTKLQLVRALKQYSIYEGFKTWLAIQDADTQEEWGLSYMIARADPRVDAFQTANNMTKEEVDDLFRLAQTL